MDTYRAIGQRLQKARERTGFTQEQAAKLLGTARGQLSYYENGRREVDIVSLAKLADLYGYSIHYFLDPEPRLESVPGLAVAFRAQTIADDDLPAIAWVNRFARNLNDLAMLLDKEGRE